MRFKPRLPLTPSQAPGEKASEENPRAEAVGTAEAQGQDQEREQSEEAAGFDPLGGAFEALAQVVRAEMEVLRQDLIQRIESSRQVQEKTLSDFSERTRESIANLEDQFQQAKDKANDRTEAVKTGLQQVLSDTEQKLQRELEALTSNLSGMRQDLQQQIATSGQMSSLLNNIANVFSERAKLPAGQQQRSP